MHVLALDVGRIADDDHRIAILASPFDVDAMEPCILDDPVENIVGGDRQDSRADFLQRQLDGVSLGDAGPRDDRDDRLDPALAELEGEGDAVELEQDAAVRALRAEAGRRNG